LFYYPFRELAIDETVTKFSGYDEDKLYFPNKPTKFGYKSTTMCCSVTNFMIRAIPYSKENYPKKDGPFAK
jgi:hypothetical protein